MSRIEVRLPSMLQKAAGGEKVLNAEATTVRDLIERLDAQHPGIRARLVSEEGALHRFVNVYRNDEDIRFLDHLDTPLSEGDVVSILPALAGGSPSMLCPSPCRSIVDTIGDTPIVELPSFSPSPGVRIFAKLEGSNPTGSVKDRIARAMIARAEATGHLSPGDTILEPTSGNTGIALALVARLKGYRLVVVMPDNVSTERVALLQGFGAEIVFSEGAKGTNGAIVLARELAARGGHFMPDQYANEANPLAHYETTGPEILRDVPAVDIFVAGLGTGGTLMGVGRFLKERRPQVRLIAAEPHQGELVSGLRSLDDGFIPPILDPDLLDGKLLVRGEDAFRLTRALLQQEGVFAGISSGAALHAAVKVASTMTRGDIVVLFADGGWKYLSTGVWTKTDAEVQAALQGKIWW